MDALIFVDISQTMGYTIHMNQFTIEEIREWLSGHKLVYSGPCHPSAKQFNETIDVLMYNIEDREDGLEAVTQRLKDYKHEDRE